MRIADVERYVSLRQTLGYKLRDVSRRLRAFAAFSANKGDTHICASTAEEWATKAPSPGARYIRLRDVMHLARFLRAEDSAHEVPSNPFHAATRRRLPYIYTPSEIVRLIGAASQLRASYPLRRRVYATLLGLIAATGLPISEDLNLRFSDLLPDGVLQIRLPNFRKTPLVPLHPTTLPPLTRIPTCP